jgi:hypothetical protein
MAPFVLAASIAAIILLLAFFCSVYSIVIMQMDFEPV